MLQVHLHTREEDENGQKDLEPVLFSSILPDANLFGQDPRNFAPVGRQNVVHEQGLKLVKKAKRKTSLIFPSKRFTSLENQIPIQKSGGNPEIQSSLEKSALLQRR